MTAIVMVKSFQNIKNIRPQTSGTGTKKSVVKAIINIYIICLVNYIFMYKFMR